MRLFSSAALVASSLATASIAEAHVSIASGTAATAKTQKITFGVGHGCEVGDAHLDTVKIRVFIPAGIAAVRAIPSEFGPASVVKDGDVVKEVSWTKVDPNVNAPDDQYYELTLRARVDAAPFTTVLFTVFQTCLRPDGTELVVEWKLPPGDTTSDGSPAAALVVAPAHTPGWNKVVIPTGMTVPVDSLGTYLGDALIVWRGTAAYSANAATMAMVSATTGVTTLTGNLVAGDELWIKY